MEINIGVVMVQMDVEIMVTSNSSLGIGFAPLRLELMWCQMQVVRRMRRSMVGVVVLGCLGAMGQAETRDGACLILQWQQDGATKLSAGQGVT